MFHFIWFLDMSMVTHRAPPWEMGTIQFGIPLVMYVLAHENGQSKKRREKELFTTICRILSSDLCYTVFPELGTQI